MAQFRIDSNGFPTVYCLEPAISFESRSAGGLVSDLTSNAFTMYRFGALPMK
jgi:hypothetical protein